MLKAKLPSAKLPNGILSTRQIIDKPIGRMDRLQMEKNVEMYYSLSCRHETLSTIQTVFITTLLVTCQGSNIGLCKVICPIL
jgi:hypothetical protein